MHPTAVDLCTRTWMQTCGDALVTRVAEHGTNLVGMAWLVIFKTTCLGPV